MIDPVAATLGALGHGDATAMPVAFAAGVVTSIGPCVAPRYVAIAAVAAGARHRALTIAVFVAGVLAGYITLGFGIGLVESLVAHASAVYLVLAAGLAASGIVQLVRRPRAADHRCAVRASGVFTLGAGSALIVSPCCTPIVAAVSSLGAAGGRPAASALLLIAFALGHALPVLGLGTTGSAFATLFTHAAGRSIVATVSGALMLGLGAYYGLLA